MGIFWRNVNQEWRVNTTTYRPKGQVDGRGERTEVGPFSFDQIKIIVL